MRKVTILLFTILLSTGTSHSQGVCICNDGSVSDPSAILDVKSTDKGFLFPRMTVAQRDAIPSPALGLTIYQTNGISGLYHYDGSAWVPVAGTGYDGHFIGEFHEGGIVFWVDHTGQHGLICSVTDQSANGPWSNVIDAAVGDSARSTWNGLQNSLATVLQAQHMNSAAKTCLDYTNLNYGTGVYNDWYLPATTQLRLLSNNLYMVNKALDLDGDSTTNIPTGIYWSSTEVSDTTAWGSGIYYDDVDTIADGIATGDRDTHFIKSDSLFVRCVREF